ncbi:hypothetical protein B0A49_05387 [Cryomyces minteri]|uniref:CID domain-containing protein n=2 Tax=Cryomyces TaxID=329878 RepID=A0A4U0X3A8_9PEZI|nr:hypothetical protein B0A49_05387 [Cryomyces minteri]
MSEKISEFPDALKKLSAPTKKSAFEKQKADAEAKRLREEAETAAAYHDFVKSFQEDNDTLPSSGTGHRGSDSGLSGPRGSDLGAAPRRHFAPTGPRGNSGPGSLGPPPSSLSRKRALDGSHPAHRDRERDRDGGRDQGLFAFENSSAGPVDAATAFRTSDDEDEDAATGRSAERAVPKPTIHLSSLPPGTSELVIRSLLPSSLTVDSVRVLPPSGPGSQATERRSMSAIVTLAKDTAGNDIDSAVNGLQNRYLGWGFYLSLARHLSSAAIGSLGPNTAGLGSSSSSLPFGARQVPTGPTNHLSRAPPPGTRGHAYAPPSSYAPSGPGQFGRAVQVDVNPPTDIKQLSLIHKTVESMITHGPEFEALLMTRPEVQRDEKWAWIWNPRSAGGVWYRWRLWEITTGSQSSRRSQYDDKKQRVFDDGAPWAAPEKALQFEFVTRLDEIVSDPDYDSSENEDSDDEGRKRRQHHRGGAPPENGADDGAGNRYLNPLHKSKLTHLLARLPTSTGRLLKSDVAAVTTFAINHAGSGADEVVNMLVSNIEKPFAWSSANPDRKKDSEEAEEDEEEKKEKEDPSSSKLIALYLISDILSSSATSGVRNAWRYRQYFETALKQRKIFEGLGRLERELQWGRLRAEKWKRSVNTVLTVWEGWSVFQPASHEHFAEMLTNPPLTDVEKATATAKQKGAAEKKTAAKSKWKTVDAAEQEAVVNLPGLGVNPMEEDINGEPLQDEDVEGEPMEEDLEGQPMEEDIEGEAMDEDTGNGQQDLSVQNVESAEEDTTGGRTLASNMQRPVGGRRQRPKAEDMFADSDGD